MILLAASILGASFFLAVARRGWPSVTIGDPAAGSDDGETQGSELVERTPAIGVFVERPQEEDEWDVDGPSIESRGRSVGFRR